MQAGKGQQMEGAGPAEILEHPAGQSLAVAEHQGPGQRRGGSLKKPADAVADPTAGRRGPSPGRLPAHQFPGFEHQRPALAAEVPPKHLRGRIRRHQNTPNPEPFPELVAAKGQEPHGQIQGPGVALGRPGPQGSQAPPLHLVEDHAAAAGKLPYPLFLLPVHAGVQQVAQGHHPEPEQGRPAGSEAQKPHRSNRPRRGSGQKGAEGEEAEGDQGGILTQQDAGSPAGPAPGPGYRMPAVLPALSPRVPLHPAPPAPPARSPGNRFPPPKRHVPPLRWRR